MIEQISKDIFGPTCSNCENDEDKCRQTATATGCSIISNSKNWRMHRGNALNQTINSLNSSRNSLERNVQKQIHFKQREKDKQQIISEKKLTILRDPILKSIGRSIHHNSNQRRLCYNAIGTDGSSSSKIGNITAPFDLVSRKCNKNYNSAIDSNFDRSVHGTADTNNVMINELQKWQLDDESTVDFKSLVNDCSNMSLSASFRSDELHKTRNFRVLQTTYDSAAAAAAAAAAGDSLDAGNTSETNTANLSTLLNSNSSLSNNSSKTSSCSQQALMNSSNCDVTIDELASYFETFVHIPKKMSSMAEMMYI